MAAGGRNPQKSAAARAKKEAKAGKESAGGGGAAGALARGAGGVGVNEAFEKAAAEREIKRAEKQGREDEKARKEAAELKKRAKAEKEAAKAAGGGKEKAKPAGEDPLKACEKEMMPLVKNGDTALAAGDLPGALALYQEAMDGFRSAGFKRPKLKEKLDAAKALLAPAPQPS